METKIIIQFIMIEKVECFWEISVNQRIATNLHIRIQDQNGLDWEHNILEES